MSILAIGNGIHPIKPIITTSATTLGNIEDDISVNMLLHENPPTEFIGPSVPSMVALWLHTRHPKQGTLTLLIGMI
jgi:hypothetical protein